MVSCMSKEKVYIQRHELLLFCMIQAKLELCNLALPLCISFAEQIFIVTVDYLSAPRLTVNDVQDSWCRAFKYRY